MNKELLALKSLYEDYIYDEYDGCEEEMSDIHHKIFVIDSALRALDIIRDKWVNMDKFMFCAIYNGGVLTWEEYCKGINWKKYSVKPLTKSEYDLLKEVFGE